MTCLSQRAWTAAQDASPVEVSFEFSLPASEQAFERLKNTAAQLEPYSPRFLSVTCGAGGTDDLGTDKSFQVIQILRQQVGTNLAAHLTCVGRSRREINQRVRESRRCLDLPHSRLARRCSCRRNVQTSHPRGYANAAELVAGIRKIADLDISVAAYPDLPSRAVDIFNLKQKLDAGANRAITQFFFDNDIFIQLVVDARVAGISQPLIPGILLIDDFAKLKNFAARCGSTIPDWLHARFAGLENDPETPVWW